MRFDSPDSPNSYAVDELLHLDAHQEFRAMLNWNPPKLKGRSRPFQVTSPLSFYDKHLDDALLLKRVVPFSSLLLDLSQTVNLALESLENLPPLGVGFPHAIDRKRTDRSRYPLEGARPIADLYEDTTFKWCSTLACTLFPAARLAHWSYYLSWATDNGSKEPWGYDTVHGSLRLNHRALDKLDVLSSEHPEDGEYSMLDIYKRSDKLATCIVHTLSDEVEHLFELMDDVASSPSLCTFQICLTRGYAPGPRICKVSLDGQKPPWTLPADTLMREASPDPPWRNTRAMKVRGFVKSPPSQGGSRRGRILPTIRPPTKSLSRKRKDAEGGSPSPQDLLQHAWVEAVRNDTTVIVLNCGNLERIGIRHRKTQTLYLSELIKTDSCRHPAYGKLETGLYLAAIEDAVDRTLQRLKADVLEQGKQPIDNVGTSYTDEDRAVTRNQKRRKIEATPSIHNSCSSPDIADILNQTKDRQLALIHLRYDLYNSPAPASFLRHGTSSNKRSFHSDTYLNLTLTSYIASGATGVLHGGTLEVETTDGHLLTHDIAVKLAFSEEQCRRLAREYSIYCHLAAANVKGILDVLGLFQDMEGQTLALVMTHGGISLWEREGRIKGHLRGLGLTTVTPSERAIFLHTMKSIHDAGVRHRDLRPENLMVNPDNGKVYIIDFDRALRDSTEEAIRFEYEYFIELLDGLTHENGVSTTPSSSELVSS